MNQTNDDFLPAGSYSLLADFRYELRRFQHFSELAAKAEGLSPQQHQALLSIHGAEDGMLSIGGLAERLLIKPHSASGLVDRLVAQGLVRRAEGKDRRRVNLLLTATAKKKLMRLSRAHLAELARIRPLLARLIETTG